MSFKDLMEKERLLKEKASSESSNLEVKPSPAPAADSNLQIIKK